MAIEGLRAIVRDTNNLLQDVRLLIAEIEQKSVQIALMRKELSRLVQRSQSGIIAPWRNGTP